MGVGMRSRYFLCEVFLWFLWLVCLELVLLVFVCLFFLGKKEEHFTLTIGIMMKLKVCDTIAKLNS